MYNHNKAQQSKSRVHISWDILYLNRVVLFVSQGLCLIRPRDLASSIQRILCQYRIFRFCLSRAHAKLFWTKKQHILHNSFTTDKTQRRIRMIYQDEDVIKVGINDYMPLSLKQATLAKWPVHKLQTWLIIILISTLSPLCDIVWDVSYNSGSVKWVAILWDNILPSLLNQSSPSCTDDEGSVKSSTITHPKQ